MRDEERYGESQLFFYIEILMESPKQQGFKGNIKSWGKGRKH